MASTHTSLYYHLIFSTKNREPSLRAEWRMKLHEYLGGTVSGLGGISYGVGGVADHVHLLVTLRPTHCLSDFMRELKKASSTWIRETFRDADFQWQEGYGAFTVSHSSKEKVREYIVQQEEHHRTKSFLEEFTALLKKSGVAFDERYLV